MASTETTTDRGAALERVQAILLLFPAALLLWPGAWGPLANDLFPELTGAGLAALASLPSAALLLVRRAAPRVSGLFLLLGFAAIGELSLVLVAPSDTLEASRATILVLTALALLFGGASLSAAGRAVFARGLAVLSLAASAAAFFDAGSYAGALGNKSSTSGAALLGALAGAWLFARDRGAWRAVGALATVAFVVHAALAPVVAGAGALALVLAIGVLLARFDSGEKRRLAALAALVLAIGSGAWFAARSSEPVATPASSSAASAPTHASGAEVRWLIWKRVPRLVLDSGWLGVGPGQFAASFPPYRDPAEIELSTFGRTLAGQETEVENAHSDWLQGLIDAGPIGGALWILFLCWTAWRALRALRSEEPGLAALGGAALGVLAFATVQEPLSWNPAASALAFATFGALLGGPEESARFSRVSRKILVGATIALLVVHAPRAWSLVRHGFALEHALTSKLPRPAALARALEACPDSVVARSLDARIATDIALAQHAGPDAPPPALEPVPKWEAVLALRPHRFEAWMELGRLYASAGHFDEALRAMERALLLDAHHPGLLYNYALVQIRSDHPERASAALEELRERGRLTPAACETFGIALLESLALEPGLALLATLDPSLSGAGPEHAYARGEELEAEHPALAEALKGFAHLRWARQQAEAGAYETAVRSYRQAARTLARDPELVPREPPSARVSAGIQLELAAALTLAKRDGEARGALRDVDVSADRIAALPPWAVRALREHGLLEAEAAR